MNTENIVHLSARRERNVRGNGTVLVVHDLKLTC